MNTTLAFIDSRVRDYEALIGAYGAEARIVMLEEGRDGMEQIEEALEGKETYESIHLVSHGASGSITVGGTELNSRTLPFYGAELAAIGRALDEGGDLLLYGCNVGRGEKGEAFVGRLAEMTGADVAASDDVTGGTAVGGDWELEVTSGVIDAGVVLAPDDYEHTLEDVPVGGEFRVNTYVYNDQIQPSVAGLSDGGFVATWTSLEQDGSGWGIYGQRYSSGGTAAGEEFRVNTGIINYQTSPSVAGLSGGGFVAAWTSLEQDGSGYGVYGQRYAADGTAVGSEFRVNTYTEGSQEYSSIAALGDGGFIVTWMSDGQDGSLFGIYGQRYSSDGTAAGEEFQVNTFTDSWQTVSSVAGLSDGGFVVTWQSTGQDGSYDGVFGQRYAADGTPTGGEFRVNTYTESLQGIPSVAALDDGGFVVTWQSTGQDGSYDGVFGQRYAADGTPTGEEFQVNAFSEGSQRFPSVAGLSDGGFVVTWMSSNQDGSGWGVYGQRYADDGATVGSEFQVNTYANDDQRYPSVASQEDGGFIVVWDSEGQDGWGYGVYGQRYNSSISYMTRNGEIVPVESYTGPATAAGGEPLAYQYIGDSADEVLIGTGSNDFINVTGGTDAVDAGAGNDVIDGGTGSNFLTGGEGTDIFFVDGRGGQTTWSTITDWEEGEQLSVWGWTPGTSQIVFWMQAGAPGYEGLTMHADLNGDAVIDTSVTFTGIVSQSELPAPLEFDGLLWFV